LAAIPTTYADISSYNLGAETSGALSGHTIAEVEVVGSTTIAAAAMTINGMVEDALTLSGTVTFTHGTEIVNLASHGMRTGAGPFYFTGTVPAELSTSTAYYAIYDASGTFKVATSRANAFAGTAVSFTDNGTGTITVASTPSATNPTWMQYKLMGKAGDGAIALILHKGYVMQFEHCPRFTAYSVSGTLDTGNVTIKFRAGRSYE
jgi:hypothetical protein